MKILRFELPGSRGDPRVGFVDHSNKQVVEAGAVLAKLGVDLPLPRAVDILAHNTENSGGLASQLGDPARFDAPRWGLEEVTYLPAIEAGSLRDFIAFEAHIRTIRTRRGT